MEKDKASNNTEFGGSTRCYGHRRSSSLPVAHAAVRGKQLARGKDGTDDEQIVKNGEIDSVNLNGLVDTITQIFESLSRPEKILLEILDERNGNNKQESVNAASETLYIVEKINNALKQLSAIQGNLKRVLPHMERILNDYKTIKERTQSRDEMLKTLDKALRRSEGRGRMLHGELQDIRDENKCLKEKAQQNESILRFLNTDARDDTSSKQERVRDLDGVGQTRHADTKQHVTDGQNDKHLSAKLGHYQKVLCDYETQLQDVILRNKELVLKINERESEVMSLNCELLKHQETLAVYEQGFKNLSKENSRLDAAFRDERKRASELSERLDDTEGYIGCITDKVASYEVELKYLRQELRKRDKKAK